MFWYFIAGYIAGVVGTLLLGRHLAKKHGGNNSEVR